MREIELRNLSRFWDKVDLSGDCWVWLGAKNNKGYGQIRFGSDCVYVHRLSYEYFHNIILYKLVVDHLCRNTLCVNPSHLEMVTNAENIRRGDVSGKFKAYCPKGHDYSVSGVRWGKNKAKFCKLCVYERSKSYRERKKSEKSIDL